MSNWNRSIFCGRYALTEKFDAFIVEVLKELNHLEDMGDWDSDDKDRYDFLQKIVDIHEECQLTEMRDI